MEEEKKLIDGIIKSRVEALSYYRKNKALKAVIEVYEKDIRLLNNIFSVLNGDTEKRTNELFCHPPNILHCKLEIRPEFDCNTCKWKTK